MKIRDRENRKILSGFWDMANFVTGNRDPIPPWWAPMLYAITYFQFIGGHEATRT